MFTMATLLGWGRMALKAVLIFVVGKIAISIITDLVKKALEKTKLDPSLHRFIISAIKAVLWAEIIIAIMSAFGFNTSSLLAVLAAAGAAIALALQGSLSNFASGILIMVTHPFGKGDYVTAGGNSGVVDSIGLLSTTLVTLDNCVVTVPNGSITGASITNFSAKDTRRVDFQIGVAYDTDIEYAKKVITEFCAKDERAFKDPAPFCEVLDHAESAIILQMRVWCNSADYWGLFFALQGGITGCLKDAGITVPFPQMDVHVKNQ